MFKAITPKFINLLDAYLLVNHPVLWMSKIHYALWHGAVLWTLSALLGAVMPINLKGHIDYELWYFLFTVLGIVILCFWIFRYVIFNKEKNYGSRKFSEEYKNFILVFISVSIFLLIPCPFEIVYSQRIANMYSDKEVLEDINTLNERDPYLVNSTNNYYSWYDSTTKIQYFTIRQLNPYGSSYYTPYYLRTDSAKYLQILTEFQLYKKYKPIRDKDVLKKMIGEFKIIALKYDCSVEKSADELADKYLTLLDKSKIPTSEYYGNDSYQYELNSTLNNLCEAKFKTLFIFTRDYLWVMFYFIISITAFLMLFKICYWQQYLIMLVVLFLYPLVMFIFTQLIPYNFYKRGAGVFESSILAFLVFSGITLIVTAQNHHRFRPFYNIFNQAFYVCLVYSLLLVVAFLHDNTNIFHNHDYFDMEYSTKAHSITEYEYHMISYNNEYWAAEYKRWIQITKYSGIAVFIISLPFFKNLFVKQLALPKKH